MESQKLDRLAELFWKGETSEEQELELREAILYGPEDSKHDELRDYFKLTEELKGETLNEVFDLQIMDEIERRSSKGSSYQFLKMAAGIAILLGLFFTLKSTLGDSNIDEVHDELVIVDTYDDPEVAYREVKKALMLVSKNMNEGMSYTGSLVEFDRATDKIEKEELKR